MSRACLLALAALLACAHALFEVTAPSPTPNIGANLRLTSDTTQVDDRSSITVPVSRHVTAPFPTPNIGARLRLTSDTTQVDGRSSITVPVSTHVTAPSPTPNIGAKLRLTSDTTQVDDRSSISVTAPSPIPNIGAKLRLNSDSTQVDDRSSITGSSSTEGTTGVIGTTLDPCSSFGFGCCADNETEAPGPEGQGCPCNATEFGCCPDAMSPAEGPESAGCPGPCSTSPHGCCQDNKTPAHGPEYEGCCFLTTFGCCPDNRKPAVGPHFEGCGCQYTLHGCCPDNVTFAQGPDNLGCGCQYTQHGCCPDRHTAASGPNYEGCACNTFQYGCCDDGVTTARGPDQYGCRCSDSKYGCCGDDETHATGPDAAGCDCSSSRHGCCPDGLTEATGPKFRGCTDAPENQQAACSLATDPGPCNNFAAMWYYDMAYGGCSRFWYGGCEGNGNRFAAKEECEDVCVHPSPKDACKLPSVKGACDAEITRWHYNSRQEQCIPFKYGGCLGNDNNFDTKELCQSHCEPSTVVDGQCNLPIDQGSCAGNYSRWGFNKKAYRCEQFIWGGCEGNTNRFKTEAACQIRCLSGQPPPQCTEQQEAGNCTDMEALWSFSQSENRCIPFYYSGCGGNSNRFESRETCEQTCPSAYVPDKCTPPPETGECSNYTVRWFFDTTIERCRQFYYGGCGGNENNFGTEAECDNSCSETMTTTSSTTTTTTTTTARPTEPQPQPERPDAPAAPEALPPPEPEVSAAEGGTATLRCLFHGNPPPKVTWMRGELTTDGDAVVDRYRLMSDGALQIVSLYRNDTGVYICVAENGLGVATQYVSLIVNDPVETPAGIAGDENAVVTGELGSPLELRCMAYGYPQPSVSWYSGYEDTMVPSNDAVYNATGNILLIRNLAVETLGHYTCHAYNGVGKPASWVVTVQAYRPEGIFLEHEFLVPRGTVVPLRRMQPPWSTAETTTAETTTTETTTTTSTTTTTEAPRPLFTELVMSEKCTDNPFVACDQIVRGKLCKHKYYSEFCCKSCVEAGQLDPQEAELQADQPLRKK